MSIKDMLVTKVADGVELPLEHDGGELYYTRRVPENPTSYNNRGLDAYRAALLYTENGVEKDFSVTAAVVGGSYDSHTVDSVKIASASDDFTGVMSVGGQVDIKNSKFSFDTKSDGSSVSDFNGYGAVINAMKGTQMTIDNTVVESVGVAKAALYCDEKSDVLITNSALRVMGGTIYEGYKNSASSYMVAPPWVLGITGSARAINIMGDSSSVTIVNSTVTANQWGVLSTDVGKFMQLVVADSDLMLVGEGLNEDSKKDPFTKRYGSGYGSYIIGNAQELFYGVHMKVGTYGAILNSGDAYYRSSKGTITVKSPSRGTEVYAGIGNGRRTEIDSDAFGFMAHGGGSINVLEKTLVRSKLATFLLKAGGVEMNIDDAEIVNGGILVQMLDDDDPLVGANLEDGHIVFKHEFNEVPGWPSENGQLSSQLPARSMAPGGIDFSEMGGGPDGPGGPGGEDPTQAPEGVLRTGDENTLNAVNVTLNGDVFNGTGYYGMKAMKLAVKLGAGAVLNGAISATETRHVDENGDQNTHFTIHEFYYLGHVENRPYFNGDNTVSVTLADGAVWNVTGEGIITSLEMGQGCRMNGRIFMDGKEVAVRSGVYYEGIMVIRPAE